MRYINKIESIKRNIKFLETRIKYFNDERKYWIRRMEEELKSGGKDIYKIIES